jgi:hypothetical protein
MGNSQNFNLSVKGLNFSSYKNEKNLIVVQQKKLQFFHLKTIPGVYESHFYKIRRVLRVSLYRNGNKLDSLYNEGQGTQCVLKPQRQIAHFD